MKQIELPFVRMDRCRFGIALAVCLAGIATVGVASAEPAALSSVASASGTAMNRGRILKSVKWGMIKINGSALEKFQLCKELGFDGMELNSPVEESSEELRAASAATGMPIHGLVDMKHWQIRLSSPDATIREEGRKILEQAIRDAHAQGGHTVLLVPGKVTGENETHDHVWSRSITEIRKVLPLASQLGVRVLIENVGNGFCQTPEQFRDYLDEIDSPWVGAYFDIGNVQTYSLPADWIRVLGGRIVKIDVKGCLASTGLCKIGDGDIDWAAVREALA